VELSINLETADIEIKDNGNHKKLEITLFDPEPENIRELECQPRYVRGWSTFWNKDVETALRHNVGKYVYASLWFTVTSPEIMAAAKKQAETVIRSMVASVVQDPERDVSFSWIAN
jgi:hypothetical protein